jgi:hypothetical protein
MRKEKPNKSLTEKKQFEVDMTNWLWDSHYWEWEEEMPNYWKCIWCELYWTSELPITKDFPLCRKNPKLIALTPNQL